MTHVHAAAEELLALFTSRERAATVAGDLVEEVGRRGWIWFWTALVGVAAALLARALGAARGRAAWLFVSAFVSWFATYAGLRAAGAVAGLQPLVLPAAGICDRPWAVQVYLAATLVLAGLLTGALLRTRAPARGVSGAALLAAFWVAAALVLPVVQIVAGTATWRCTLMYLLGLPLLYALPLLAGGLLGARARWARAR